MTSHCSMLTGKPLRTCYKAAAQPLMRTFWRALHSSVSRASGVLRESSTLLRPARVLARPSNLRQRPRRFLLLAGADQVNCLLTANRVVVDS